MKRILRGAAVTAALALLTLSAPALAGEQGATGQSPDDGMTAVGTARVEWQPLKHLLLTAGGTVMFLRTEGTVASRDVELDQTLYGPIVGVGIPF